MEITLHRYDVNNLNTGHFSGMVSSSKFELPGKHLCYLPELIQGLP